MKKSKEGLKIYDDLDDHFLSVALLREVSVESADDVRM